MGKAYYGSRISDNQIRTAEGYLICLNVPIARAGWQEYLGREIGPSLEPDRMYQVYRDPLEVFHPACIASWEGKTITDGHVQGPDMINAGNESFYHRGHAQNVRQGAGDESDLLLADQFIKDPVLISKVENGTRDVSCGYHMDYVPFDDDPDKFRQVNIRGNHIAIVPSGRAGDRVAIKDEKPNTTEGRQKKMDLKDLFIGWFKSRGADAKPEEVAEALELTKVENATKTSALDAAEFAAVKKDIEEIKGSIAELIKSDKQVHKSAGLDALDALEKEIEEKKEKAEDEDKDDDDEKKKKEDADKKAKDAEAANVINPDDRPDNPVPGADSKAAIKAAITTMRPIIAAIPDAETRKKASDALAAELKKIVPSTQQKASYADLLKLKKATDAAAPDDGKLGKEIKQKYHRKNIAK